MADELVSVVMPVHNAGRFVRAALARLLEQGGPLEVIVVDDASSDDSLAQVRRSSDPRVRVVHGTGQGVAASLNEGLAQARGSIVMRCDADDLYSAGRIREQALWLDAHPEYDAVCGAFATMDAKSRLLADLLPRIGLEPEEITEEIRSGQLRTSLCTYAIRSSLVRRSGGFRCYFESAEDLDYQFRLAELGRICYLPRTWYLWRLHAGSTTHSQIARRDFFARKARDFRLQRAASGIDDLQRGSPPPPPTVEREEGGCVATTHIRDMLVGRAWLEHAAGDKAGALTTGLRALCTDPYRLAAWKNLAVLAVKRSGRQAS